MTNMNKYKIYITYDGSLFCGWQKQPNGKTIQEMLETALFQIIHKKILVIGSGRTDAGVHAIKQVAHFSVENLSLSPKKLLYSLNGCLPKEIRILNIESVKESFHARHSAISKEYHYVIYNSSILSPFFKNYCYHYYHYLDIELMKNASKLFLGTHDFKNFANTGRTYKSTIRKIFSIEIEETNLPIIKIKYSGNGFLYKMVRNMTGILIAIGAKKIPIESITSLLTSNKKTINFTTAPAQGLFLYKVNY